MEFRKKNTKIFHAIILHGIKEHGKLKLNTIKNEVGNRKPEGCSLGRKK